MKSFILSITIVTPLFIAGCGYGAKTGYGVDELADKAVAQKEAFMGKEVVVSGYASSPFHNLDSNGYKLGLDFDLYSPIERQLICIVPQGRAPERIDSKWVTVKGTIVNIHSQSYMDLKSVKLDPCEIMNAE